MDRRQVLAGLAGSLTLGSGCLGLFDSDSDGSRQASSADAGKQSPTATATQSFPEPTTAETGQPTTSQTATHSSPATPPADSSSEAALIDTANLATYTSDTVPYSIKYPGSWQVTETNQETVKFTAPANSARMLVRVKDGVPTVVPRETIIETAVQRARRRYSIEQVTRVGQREITLSNGTPATVIKTRLSRSADVTLRGTFLVAHAADTVYAVGVLVPERAATPTVERAMKTLVESLTIHNTTSTRPE